jgi:hypothetical protein
MISTDYHFNNPVAFIGILVVVVNVLAFFTGMFFVINFVINLLATIFGLLVMAWWLLVAIVCVYWLAWSVM